MNKSDVIRFLRTNVIVQLTDTQAEIDPAYLAMTDSQIEDVMTVALSKDFPNNTLDNIPNKILYPLVLLSKKELYFQLASSTAPLYPLGADGASLKKDIRFDHYMKLIQEVNSQYNQYLNEGKEIISGNIYLDNRYFSVRNYNNAKPPEVLLTLDSVYATSAEVSWEVLSCVRFYNFVLYKGTSQIVDVYEGNKISESAEKVDTISDIHSLRKRITGLTPNTEYHVALIIQEQNGLKGVSEIVFTTLVE